MFNKPVLKSVVWFVIFMVLALIVWAIVGGVCSSASNQRNAILSYNNIKITYNDTPVYPTDSNGNCVEPFIIDGTTYLPVRAIANALGLEVSWDGTTSTVKLSNTASNFSDSQVVYITKTGTKYHSNPNCGNGNYIETTMDNLPSNYIPCSKCYN